MTRCICGSVRDVPEGVPFPAHPDLRYLPFRFRWCVHGDMSSVIVGVVA